MRKQSVPLLKILEIRNNCLFKEIRQGRNERLCVLNDEKLHEEHVSLSVQMPSKRMSPI